MFERFKSRWEDFLEAHPDLTDYLAFGKSLFPPINFISLHYAYFIVSSLFFSGIFYASSTPGDSIRYIDCLFLVVSAMTDTGLNTVNLSQINTWQQVLMFLLFIFGSAIWISFLTVIARKHAFEKRFDHIVEAGREERRQRRLFAQENQTSGPSIRQFLSFDRFSSNTGQPIRRFFTMDRFKSSPPEVNTLPGLGSRQPPVEMEETEKYSRQVNSPLRRVVSAPEEDIPSDLDNEISKTTTLASQAPPPSPRDHISFIETLPVPPNTGGATSSAYQPGNQLPHRTNARRPSTIASEASDESEDFTARWKRILTKGNTSKRGQFFDLSSDEREALGGCEYRALKALAIAVPLYGFVWQFIGALSLSIWIAKNASNRALDNGQNPIWTGIFLSVSAFNNAGMSLMDANMTAFQKDYFPLFVVGMLVLAGNTAYPLFLRFLFWATLKTMQLTTRPARKAHWKETFEFILKYPRRVYTTLFNSRATWWLLGVLFATNIIDWVAFEVLNIGNPVTEAMSINDRIIAGWFQAIGKFPPFPFSNWKAEANSINSCSRGRLLRRIHRGPVSRSSTSLYDHDVHLRLPRVHHHAPLQRLRGAISRHLRRRPFGTGPRDWRERRLPPPPDQRRQPIPSPKGRNGRHDSSGEELQQGPQSNNDVPRRRRPPPAKERRRQQPHLLHRPADPGPTRPRPVVARPPAPHHHDHRDGPLPRAAHPLRRFQHPHGGCLGLRQRRPLRRRPGQQLLLLRRLAHGQQVRAVPRHAARPPSWVARRAGQGGPVAR